MKVIQNALLYNKIEYYNTGVQRSPSLSQRLHSLLKAAFDSKYKMFGRAPEYDWTLWRWPEADCTTWRKHRKSPHWPRVMVFLRSKGGRIFWFHLTIRSGGIWSFVYEHLFHQKVIQQAWSFPRCHFWGKRGGFETSQGMLSTTISTATPAAIPTVTMTSPQAWLVHRVQRDLGEG